MGELENSIRDLDRAMKLVQKKTRRNAQNSVLQACIHLTRSGRQPFKKRDKKTRRQVFRSAYSVATRRASRGADYIFVVLKQSGASKLLRRRKWNKRKSPYIPENIGIAWRSWGWILRSLPGNRSGGDLTSFHRHAKKVKSTAYVDHSRHKSKNSTISIQNNLTYLEDHVPGLSADIIQKAANKMEKIANNDWGKVKKSWQ